MASLAGEHEVMLVVRSDGVLAGDVRPLVRLNVTVIVESNGRREQGSSGGGGRFTYEYFRDADQALAYAREAVRQALVNLDADGRPGRHACRWCSAPAGRAFCCTRPSATVWKAISTARAPRRSPAASGNAWRREQCTVVDDGTLPDRRGSLNVDDEGTPTQKTVLIENGILKGYLQDTLNARLMGVAPTGNGRRESYAHLPMPRMTNTYMLAGNHDPEEIIASVEQRPVRRQLRRRPGGHHQWQVRVLRLRGLSDRERQDHAAGQGRDPDRQRAGRADARVHGRQRPCSSTPASAPAARKGRACRSASASRRSRSTA